MFKKIAAGIITASLLGLTVPSAFAAGEVKYVDNVDFSFDGPFGRYDQNQLQRGLQVYTQACASCHGLEHVAFRTLGDAGGPHYSDDEVRAYAANYEVFDPEIDDFRPAIPSDHFGASALANAPDLSVMAKARAGFSGPAGLGINQFFKGMGGPDYIASLLRNYTGETKTEAGVTLYENKTFGWIAMKPPLADGDIEFSDGSPNDVASMTEDVAAFLMWTAEPKMMQRKQAGLVGVIFLSFFAVLLFLTNKRLWADVKKKYK